MRSMVEGGRRKREDCSSCLVRIRQHIAGRNPQYAISLSLKPGLSGIVALGLIAPVVHFTVYFDDQPHCGRIEIHNVGIDRMLLAKADPHRRSLETLPKQYFR
jgi:hypothetical protein